MTFVCFVALAKIIMWDVMGKGFTPTVGFSWGVVRVRVGGRRRGRTSLHYALRRWGICVRVGDMRCGVGGYASGVGGRGGVLDSVRGV